MARRVSVCHVGAQVCHQTRACMEQLCSGAWAHVCTGMQRQQSREGCVPFLTVTLCWVLSKCQGQACRGKTDLGVPVPRALWGGGDQMSTACGFTGVAGTGLA